MHGCNRRHSCTSSAFIATTTSTLSAAYLSIHNEENRPDDDELLETLATFRAKLVRQHSSGIQVSTNQNSDFGLCEAQDTI